MTLKTLPRFNISNPAWQGRECMVYIQQPSILGTQNPDYSPAGQTAATESVLSGFYIIFGYKHVISQNEVTSSFTLTKGLSAATLSDFTSYIPLSAREIVNARDRNREHYLGEKVFNSMRDLTAPFVGNVGENIRETLAGSDS